MGRSPECGIVLQDPRVSRSHASLRLGERIEVADLGSANGTFVNGERLCPGGSRVIAIGEVLSLGDLALLIRSSGLRVAAPEQFIAPADIARVAQTLARRHPPTSQPAAWVVFRVCYEPAQDWAVDVILGDQVAAAPSAWVVKLGRGERAVGFEIIARVDPASQRHALEKCLKSWGIVAGVDARFAAVEDLVASGEGVSPVLQGNGPLRLRGGAFLFQDDAMKALHRTILRVAAAPVSVLILGETGVGKDVVASLLHESSPRAAGAFLRLNCASLPEGLLESELFGYERGAFTGATGAKPGLLEVAEGGTVFLDEVGELPPSVQVKLLLALERGEVMRLGATKPRRINVRFVAATNRNLAHEVEGGRFRADLFYRLNCVTLTVPPLRERPAEIALLAQHFLDSALQRFGVAGRELSLRSMDALRTHSWPGNVRELRNAIERAVLLATDRFIEPEHLALAGELAMAVSNGDGTGDAGSDRDQLEAALAQTGFNQTRAAELLGVSRRTVVRRIARMGLSSRRR